MTSVFYDNQSPIYRNAAKTTSLKIDNANNRIEIANTVINKKILINAEEFSNGTQTLPYQQMYENINAVEACQYPPSSSNTLNVNDTIVLDNGGANTSTLNNSSLTLTDATYTSVLLNNELNISDNVGETSSLTNTELNIQDAIGASARLNKTALKIDDGTSSLQTYIVAGTATFLSTASGQNTLITPSAITTTDAVSYTSSLDNANLTFSDTSTNISLQLTNDSTVSPTPFIKMTETSGLVNTFSWGELNADGHYCYTFNNNERFFKQQNPFSFRQVELLDGDYIERSHPFIFVQAVSTLKLRDPADYLDDNGNAGWSCVVSNYSGSDLNIDIGVVAFGWYSHAYGFGTNPIIFNKFATARITLTYSSADLQYRWAVSTF
jgi:hypothetical protein